MRYVVCTIIACIILVVTVCMSIYVCVCIYADAYRCVLEAHIFQLLRDTYLELFLFDMYPIIEDK